VAVELGSGAVAFPAISTGIYRFPVERAAAIALVTTAAELERHPAIQEVRFVLFSDEHLQAFQQHLPS
jgi:O-acetyl-ADP-ribose deacetylase